MIFSFPPVDGRREKNTPEREVITVAYLKGSLSNIWHTVMKGWVGVSVATRTTFRYLKVSAFIRICWVDPEDGDWEIN